MTILSVLSASAATPSFETPTPLDQRKRIFELEKKVGSCLSRSPLHLFRETTEKAARQREYFQEYIDATQYFQKRYEKILVRQIKMPSDGDISIQDYQKFKAEFWDGKFLASDQVEFLELLVNRLNILTVSIFRPLLEDIKPFVRLGRVEDESAKRS